MIRGLCLGAGRSVVAAFALTGALATSVPCVAQRAHPAVIALDTVMASDEAVDSAGHGITGVTLDAVLSTPRR